VRVLIADDSTDDRLLLRYYLETRGHSVVEAGTGAEALLKARENPPDLVISDGLMPEMDGFTLLRTMRMDEHLAHIPFVFYSSVFKDAHECELAESLGAAAFIVKGADEEEFWRQLETVLTTDARPPAAPPDDSATEEVGYLRRYSSVVALRLEREVAELRAAKAALAADVAERERAEAALLESNTQLERMVYDVAEAMGRIVEARDPYTQGHQERTAAVCKEIAAEMGLSDYDIASLTMAALVHDIGQLGVPAEILTRPGRLSTIEFQLVQDHPQQSYEILRGIAFPWPVADIAHQHHERLDGSGYPLGLKDAEILPLARILAVADVVEAMASHRPYRPALGVDAALAELRGSPKYDQDVVATCEKLHRSGRLDEILGS